ncbi:MAG: hypothetical protein K2N35_12825, partial [Muribaculaceae bacterium]|nr:hypothetical protein [Muribaculaceae bacterium]
PIKCVEIEQNSPIKCVEIKENSGIKRVNTCIKGRYKIDSTFENLVADFFGKMSRKLYYFHKNTGIELDFLMRYLPLYMTFLLTEV